MLSRYVVLFVAAYLLATVGFSAVVFFTLRNLEPDPVQEPRDQRPDIRHCFNDDVDLWGCIRYQEENRKWQHND